MRYCLLLTLLPLALLAACDQPENAMPPDSLDAGTPTFGDDAAFLAEHADLVVLSDEAGLAKVAVSPAMQGRVLTSTAAGDDGPGFGWINREVIASGVRQEHINVFGGEDRFWLGPEGGQFSIYFKEGDPFDLDHWYVPAAIDWEPFTVVEKEPDRISFEKAMQLTNYSGTSFDLRVNRAVRLLGRPAIEQHLGLEVADAVSAVAFETVNTVTNTGSQPWTKEGGLLSIWILGMYNPSPSTTVVIPYLPGSEEELGPIVNAAYFGEVPADRLVVDGDVVYFKGDGEFRSKIGLSNMRSMPTFGSYDNVSHVLTLVQYTMPEGAADYVNSMWELQEDPFEGDVINSYNDGPPAPGEPPLGPFYELETSSPAMALAPGEAYTHVHRTIHLQGSPEALDRMALATLGKSLEEIGSAFAN